MSAPRASTSRAASSGAMQPAASSDSLDGDGSRKRRRVVESGLDSSNIIAGGSSKRRAGDGDGVGGPPVSAGGFKIVFKKPAAEPVHRVTPTEIRTDALKLITLVETEKNEGRLVGEVFAVLPDSTWLPDYYELIKRPIAIRDIRQRLDAGEYPSLAAVKQDLDLINAKRYNLPGSPIYQDAQHIHKLLKLRYGAMTGALPPDAEQQHRAELTSPLNALKDWLNGRLKHLLTTADPSGRLRCGFFMELPSRETPHYYTLITHPMAFNMIQNKINRRQYLDVQSFRDDVKTVFANAKYFNQEASLVWQDADALEVASAAFADVMHYIPPEFDAPTASTSAPPVSAGQPKLKLKLNIGGATSAGVDSPTPKLTFKMGSAMTPAAAPVPEPIDERTAALMAAQAEKDAAIAALPVIDYATADPAEVLRHLHVRGVHPQPSSRQPPPPPLTAARQATIAQTGQPSAISHIVVSSKSDVLQSFSLANDVVRQHSIVLRRGVDAIEIVPSLADSFAPGLPPVLNLRCVCRPPSTTIDQEPLTSDEATARGTRASVKLVARPTAPLSTIDLFIRPPGHATEELYRLFVRSPA